MSYHIFTIENPPLYFNNRLRFAFIGRWNYAEAHFASQYNCWKKPLRINFHQVQTIVPRYKFGGLDGANGERNWDIHTIFRLLRHCPRIRSAPRKSNNQNAEHQAPVAPSHTSTSTS